MVEKQKEAILLGEIGALLHMFGKCSSQFLRYYSQKDGPDNQGHGDSDDGHASMDVFSLALRQILDPVYKAAFKFPDPRGGQDWVINSFADIPEKYKGIENKQRGPLLDILNVCHHMTSADEKGVVRRKQSISDIYISTPFGYRFRKLDPDSLDRLRAEMDRALLQVFDLYHKKKNSIEYLRDQSVDILRPGLSRALGETRQPANDVTLWSQSYGVASLYKPVLAILAMGAAPCPPKQDGSYDFNQLRWRLLGFGWNGLGFIKCGRKPADILRRQEMLNEIVGRIQRAIEVEYPLGNLFYRDLNGIFFTFPGIGDQLAEDLVRELAEIVVPDIRTLTDDELWPFLTLSRPSRTLTIITQEIGARNDLAASPRVATILSLQSDPMPQKILQKRKEILLLPSPPLASPGPGQDICPVCRFRSKHVLRETCEVCEDRRSGWQSDWQANPGGRTIWVNEVADDRNRIALLTLRFDLLRWLSGEWFETVLSQTLVDWAKGAEFDRAKKRELQINAYARRKTGFILDLNQPSLSMAMQFAQMILNKDNPSVRALLLQTFFERDAVKVEEEPQSNLFVDRHLERIREKMEVGTLQPQDILKYCFCQNPSPARLLRCWEETEEFLNIWVSKLKDEIFAERPQRLHFRTVSPVEEAHEGRTYRATVPGLLPEPLVVLCLNGGGQDFVTVDNLGKFRFEPEQGRVKIKGIEAVQRALLAGGIISWVDEESGRPLAQGASPVLVEENSFTPESYLPYIVLASSPVFCQVLVPAARTRDVLEELLKLYDQRFEKVRGKLPLHIGLLVAKRKFPLYALLEAGQQILDGAAFQAGRCQRPWWNPGKAPRDLSMDFYGYYPNKGPEVRGFQLEDLAEVSPDGAVWLTPGYFDFDFLGSTADRQRLVYKTADGKRPVRPSIAYGQVNPRPFPLHRLREAIDLWKKVFLKISTTQRHQVEQTLATKLEEWRNVGDEVWPVFRTFGRATLRQTFTEFWDTLGEEGQRQLETALEDGLLLDALELFQHVVKEGMLYE